MMERHILLSGGIGSGKSAVASALKERGFFVVEADNIGHEVLEPTGEAFSQVVEEWPSVVSDGRIDRGRLGAIVFEDPLELSKLESISHPAIRDRILRLIRESREEVVFVDMALLSTFLPGSWMRVVVDASDETRRQRLLARGMTEREIVLRMRAQPSRSEWLAAADWVVPNDGDLGELRAGVDQLVDRIVTEAIK